MRVTLMIVVPLVAVLLGVAAWALNRFVIDHVEIGDVTTYEQQVNPTQTDVSLSTFPPSDASSSNGLNTGTTHLTVSSQP